MDFSNRITPKVLMEISGPKGLAFSIKLAIYYAFLILGVWLVINGDWSELLCGLLVLGLTFAHGVELQHQVLHGSAYRNKSLSRIIGFFLGLPMLVSYSSYQFSHLNHHDKVGTEDDVEFFEFNKLGGDKVWIKKILSFFLVTHYIEFFKRAALSLVGRNVIADAGELVNRKVRVEYIAMSLIIATFLILSVLYQIQSMLFCWLIPLIIVSAPVHTLIELPEHFGCDNASSNILRNTRSIRSGTLFVWFTNGNNYHVEHHMYPLVRPEKLSILHKILESDISFRNNSYSEFFFESL